MKKKIHRYKSFRFPNLEEMILKISQRLTFITQKGFRQENKKTSKRPSTATEGLSIGIRSTSKRCLVVEWPLIRLGKFKKQWNVTHKRYNWSQTLHFANTTKESVWKSWDGQKKRLSVLVER